MTKSPRKPSSKPRAGTRARAAEAGPVTLEEARRLVRRDTVATARAARMETLTAAASAGVAPEAVVDAELFVDVASERERLARAAEAERRLRKADYDSVMEVMESRGARAAVTAAADARTFRPLRIFAEGDSWFNYPPFNRFPLFRDGGGVPDRLAVLLGVPILNWAKAGDEVRFMLGVEQRADIISTLSNAAASGRPWDAMLFSGGGNDIVDKPLVIWLRDFKQGAEPADLIEQSRFAAALGLVRAGYEELIALRDQLSPNTHLFFHGYDFAIPDGRGFCGRGPWLQPAFLARRYNEAKPFPIGARVVKLMLQQFAEMLKDIAKTHKRITIVDTQGTLQPVIASWHNELHPSDEGFDLIAKEFEAAVKKVFPDRVA